MIAMRSNPGVDPTPTMHRPGRPGPRAVAAAATLAVVVTLVGTWRGAAVFGFPTFGIDDANVTMVYGRNLVDGHGFVYTPGGERVEGVTSMAWTFVHALGFLFTDAPERFLLIVSMALCAVSVFVVLYLASYAVGPLGSLRRPHGVRYGALAGYALAVAWVAGLPGFYVWHTITLMDLTLWTALIHVSLFVLARDAMGGWRERPWPIALAGIVVALVLTRPEALAVAPGLVVLAMGLAASDTGSASSASRRFVPAAVACAAAMGGITVFRLWYFGFPLPNTYYAKVSPDALYSAIEGLKYVGDFLTARPVRIPLVVVPLVVGLLAVRRFDARRGDASPHRTVGVIVSAVVVGGMLLPLVVGGDHFGSFRFLQPFNAVLFLPLLFAAGTAVATWPALTRSLTRWGRSAGLPVAAALVGFVWYQGGWGGFPSNHGMEWEFSSAVRGRLLGTVLNEVFNGDERPRVAEIVAGSPALVYDGPVLDLMGLNWVEMGHSPGDRKGFRNHSAFDPDVFWRATPEIVTPVATGRPLQDATQLGPPFYREALQDIFSTRRFRETYTAGYVPATRAILVGFFSREWVAQTNLSGFTAVPWTPVQSVNDPDP